MLSTPNTKDSRLKIYPCSRTLWQDEDANRKIKTKGRLNEEGYVNVGDQLGLPSERGEFRKRDHHHHS